MKPLGPIVSPRLRRQFADAKARQVSIAEVRDSEWAGRQLAAIQRVWADAVSDVPYYADLIAAGGAPKTLGTWDDVRSIPVLTRDVLQERPDAFIRRSARPDGYTRTAGSTGTPLSIGVNQSERDLMRIVKLGAWQELGYEADSRVFIMWGHAHLLGTGWSRRINQVRRILADHALGYRRVNAYRLGPEMCAVFAEQLIAFRPHAFISYASALDLFARYTQEYRERFRALGLKFVLATTEPPPRPDTLAILSELFGCPVVQEYGGGEFGQVAFNHADGFRVYGDLNYVERAGGDEVDPGARAILITSLYQRYVPLIRYRIGDAVRGAAVLGHGHVHRFQEVAGRLNDVIQLRPGDYIHSLAIFHCLHQEPSVYNVQMALYDDRIELRLVAPHADRRALEPRVRARLTQIHPALANAQFVYRDDVQTTRAGKRRWFVDERTAIPCAESPAS